MRYIGFFLLFLLVACENSTAPESRTDKLAASLCGCTEQLFALNKQAQASFDSLSFRNIEMEYSKARRCANELGVNPEDRAALETALKIKCPALAENQELLKELIGE